MPGYKNCLVPKCNNTTAVTPNKIFFQIPRNAEIRTKWTNAMKRINKPALSSKSALYCCEDHFDLAADMEKYQEFKLGKLPRIKGKPPRLKKGVVPHKFDCQKKEEVTILLKLSAYQKQLQIACFEKALNSHISPENLVEVPVEFVKCEPVLTNTTEEEGITENKIPENESNGCPSHRSIGTQADLKKMVRSQGTQTDSSQTKKRKKSKDQKTRSLRNL